MRAPSTESCGRTLGNQETTSLIAHLITGSSPGFGATQSFNSRTFIVHLTAWRGLASLLRTYSRRGSRHRPPNFVRLRNCPTHVPSVTPLQCWSKRRQSRVRFAPLQSHTCLKTRERDGWVGRHVDRQLCVNTATAEPRKDTDVRALTEALHLSEQSVATLEASLTRQQNLRMQKGAV